MLNGPLLILQRLVGLVDRLNDRLTSYRLVLYFLIILLAWTLVGSLTDQIPYSWDHIVLSGVWLVAICWGVSKLISYLLDVPANKESSLISGLILALILTPAVSGNDYTILALAAAAAMASKYILVLRRSHIFNPAAFGAFIAGEVFNYYPSWWVGTKFTAPILAIGGILILRKIKRFSLGLTFCAVYVLVLIWSLPGSSSTDTVQHLVWLGVIGTSLLFFTTIMLPEPLTSPAKLNPTILYGLVVGVFYSYNKLHTSPEEALLIGNLLTFVIAPNRRYKLSFVRKVQEAEGIYSYVFSAPKRFKFQAGQYMEWTMAQKHSDSRGNRRYFTISSSPTEKELAFTVKVPDRPSAFKRGLEALRPGDSILASYLSGSFTLPPDQSKKLAFLAGGVGITPFRSMVKYLVDADSQRDVALLYSANKPEEIAFRSLFKQAGSAGLKSLYTNLIDAETIRQGLPDYKERTFYISGPYAFVQAMERLLLGLGITPSHIVTDYFPGYGA